MELEIKPNPYSGGLQCDFEHNGKQYWADRNNVPFCGMETMIFERDENGDIDYTGVYCDRSGRSLEECINEFINEQQ